MRDARWAGVRPGGGVCAVRGVTGGPSGSSWVGQCPACPGWCAGRRQFGVLLKDAGGVGVGARRKQHACIWTRPEMAADTRKDAVVLAILPEFVLSSWPVNGPNRSPNLRRSVGEPVGHVRSLASLPARITMDRVEEFSTIENFDTSIDRGLLPMQSSPSYFVESMYSGLATAGVSANGKVRHSVASSVA